jgi:hypothetical protein
VGPVIFADDNLSPLSLTHAEQITPILDLYHRYTGVSGLNINVRKSTILRVNCTPELLQDLQTQGFSTPPMIRHLGIELGTNIKKHNQGNHQQDRPQGNKKEDPCHGTTY